MEEDEIPLGTFPDVQESIEQAAEADRCLGVTTDDRLIDEAWQTVPPCPQAVPPCPPDVQEEHWVPPGSELWVPPAGEASIIRRLNGYMTERYVADVPSAWENDYRVLTIDEPAERNCTITIDGYVRQEKYDELVNEFNNLKAKVDRLESFLSTVSSPDDEMMTI